MKQRLIITIEVDITYKDEDDYLTKTLQFDAALSDILLKEQSFGEAVITTQVDVDEARNEHDAMIREDVNFAMKR